MFNYKWNIFDGYPANGIKKHGSKVFSCFSCGGGSTMGYKLAGYEVVGCNEIDPRVANIYKKNHNPDYCYIEKIQDFKQRKDLPDVLYNLDILDGSPPCSSFSTAGNREKDWGKNKKFSEGQSEQVLDTLFFDFIELASTIKPKIIIAENVKGLLIGKAKDYVKKIINSFDSAGYATTFKLLNSKNMGVPQNRERVFFMCIRKDLLSLIDCCDIFCSEPFIDMDFNINEIKYSEIKTGKGKSISKLYKERWEKRKHTDMSFCDIMQREENRNTGFSDVFAHKNYVMPTLTSKGNIYDFDDGYFVSDESLILSQTFPQDYDFCGNKPCYILGMSVPPVMMAHLSHRIYKQWLKKISGRNKNTGE